MTGDGTVDVSGVPRRRHQPRGPRRPGRSPPTTASTCRRADPDPQGDPGGRRHGRRLGRRRGRAGGARPALGAGRAATRVLFELAAGLGSDVPFGLVGRNALGTGRGEQVEQLPGVEVARWWVVVPADGEGLVHPRRLPPPRRAASRGAGRRRPRRTGWWRSWATPPTSLAPLLHNDLQPAALDLRPGLADLLAAGEAAGALRGIVSGSGPTCVFLCGRRGLGPGGGGRAAFVAAAGAGRLRPGPGSAGPMITPCACSRRSASNGDPKMSTPNLLNLERVSKAYGVRPLLTRSRSGSRPGSGSASSAATATARPRCCDVMTGLEQPDAGRVSRVRGPARRTPPPGATGSPTPTPCARRCSAGWPTTSGPPTRAPARSSRCCWPA